jgi:quercetin dioxygenase-like cupin family protein
MKRLDPHGFPSKPADPSYFTGAVELQTLGETVPPTNVKLFRVAFPAGARTNWHTHSGVQVLVVAAGRCRFQHAGGPVEEAATSDAIWIPAGEKHWHGATPDAPMVHLAFNVDLDTAWLEPVTDEEYSQGREH